MTTNKQLQEFLKTFPDEMNIHVISTDETERYSYERYTCVYELSLDLSDDAIANESWFGHKQYPTYCLEGDYDYDTEVFTPKTLILGYRDE